MGGGGGSLFLFVSLVGFVFTNVCLPSGSCIRFISVHGGVYAFLWKAYTHLTPFPRCFSSVLPSNRFQCSGIFHSSD